jgi:hypothetical protein
MAKWSPQLPNHPSNASKFFGFCMVLIAGLMVLNTVIRSTGSAPMPQPEAKTPGLYAEGLIGHEATEKDASLSEGILRVNLALDPYYVSDGLAVDMVKRNAAEIVPGVFARFPEVTEISIMVNAQFVDRRGHESTDQAMIIDFTRDNASTIVFKNLTADQIFDLADRHWVHPHMH